MDILQQLTALANGNPQLAQTLYDQRISPQTLEIQPRSQNQLPTRGEEIRLGNLSSQPGSPMYLWHGLPGPSNSPDFTYNPNPNTNIPYSSHDLALVKLLANARNPLPTISVPGYNPQRAGITVTPRNVQPNNSLQVQNAGPLPNLQVMGG